MDWAFARWIWLEGDGKAYNQHVVFQRDFRLDKPLAQAILSVTADSLYRLRINGQWSADGPARAYPEHYSFDTIDCSHLLRNGLNRLEVDVHYFGCGTYKSLCQRGGLLLDLKLCFADGEVEHIGTDNSWRAAVIPQRRVNTLKRSNQLEQVEYFDASVVQTPMFEPAAVVCDPEAGPWKNLTPRATPMLTRREALIRRVTGAKTVNKELKVLMLNPHEIVFPGNNSINCCDSAVVCCAVEFSCKAAGEIGLISNRAGVAVNGTVLENGQPAIVNEGKNFLVFFPKSVNGHLQTSFGIAFADPDNVTVDKMYRAVIPEFCIREIDSPVDWANDRFKERNCLYQEKLKQLVALSSMNDFCTAFPSAEEFEESELFSDAGAMSFQNRVIREDVACTVDNPQSLIYPDDRCTIVHPVEVGDVELCCDLGEQNVGYWNFVIFAAAGTVIDVYAVEHMDQNGEIQHTGNDYFNCMRYVCSEGWNRFTSSVRRGGRYIFITLRHMTAPVRIQSFRLVESTYPVIPCGEFHSSDRMLDQIFEISERTLKLCMEDTFVDCSAYEQTFWIGDARNEMLFALSCFGAPDLVKHCAELVGESVKYMPFAGSQVPSGWSISIPAFSFNWVLSLKDLFRELGDVEFLKKIYPRAQQLIEHAISMIDPETGLMKSFEWNMFEWSNVSIRHPFLLYNSMLLKGNLDILASLADAAGAAPGTAERYRKIAADLTVSVNRMWDDRSLAYFESINSEGNKVAEYSMHTSMLSLLFDMTPENRRAAVCANTVSPRAELEKIVSPYAYLLWFDTLEKLGMPDLILEKIRSGYAGMLQHGATTVWETFPGARKFRGLKLSRSHCHAWSAVPLYTFPRIILGIKVENGCRNVKISPWITGLDHASGTRWTPFGPLQVQWRTDDNILEINVSAPPEIQVEFENNLSLYDKEVKFNIKQSREV